MSGREDFQYTIMRVVPRIERGEQMNVGVVLYCPRLRFLRARMHLDEARLAALAPDLDVAALRPLLDALVAVAAGDPSAGPLARLSPSERFGWLAAPSSTILQPSAAHTGLCTDPEATLDHLVSALVLPAPAG